MSQINKEEILNFSILIESIVRKKRISCMDAIIDHCSASGMEIEVAAKLISPAIKSRIKMEAEQLNFLPKSNTIPLPFQ